ncbi:MAG: hypothetical protein IBX41_05250 [Methanophagales archaeon]|nr:hypothetical protein [Methanophagales archaeon]
MEAKWKLVLRTVFVIVVVGSFERVKIKGTFPVLPIHLGNKNEPGVTLLVFINPDDESVIGIGYDYRRNS